MTRDFLYSIVPFLTDAPLAQLVRFSVQGTGSDSRTQTRRKQLPVRMSLRTRPYGKRAISADTTLRLSRYFGMSDRFWINLQSRYDIEMEKDLLADRLDREVRPRAAAG